MKWKNINVFYTLEKSTFTYFKGTWRENFSDSLEKVMIFLFILLELAFTLCYLRESRISLFLRFYCQVVILLGIFQANLHNETSSKKS